MHELVDDPLVLDAALALIDEWYADSEKGARREDIRETEAISETLYTHGLRKRKHEELAWLRATVQQLHQCAVKRSNASVESEEYNEVEEHDASDSLIVRKQAKRVLHAVHSFHQLHTRSLSLAVVQRFSIRPLDAEHIVDTFNSRLDALALIARVNQTNAPLRGREPEMTDTPNGFRLLAQSTMCFPFKLSIVNEVVWRALKGIIYGPSHDEELSMQRPNEVLGMVASSVRTPSGFIANDGPTVLRRVFEADGSVVILHSSIGSAPPSRQQLLGTDASDDNLAAGCTMKQAGWSRLRLVNKRHGRPLVVMETVTGVVVETMPGCSLSNDRQRRLLRVMNELSASRPRTRQTLENQLLDMSLASEKT